MPRSRTGWQVELSFRGRVLTCRPFPAHATVTAGEASDADLIIPGVGARAVLLRAGEPQAPAGFEPLDPEADAPGSWRGRVRAHPEIEVSIRRRRWPKVEARRLRAHLPPGPDMAVGAIAALLVSLGTASVTLAGNVVPEQDPAPWMSPGWEPDASPVVTAMFAPADEVADADEADNPWTPEEDAAFDPGGEPPTAVGGDDGALPPTVDTFAARVAPARAAGEGRGANPGSPVRSRGLRGGVRGVGHGYGGRRRPVPIVREFGPEEAADVVFPQVVPAGRAGHAASSGRGRDETVSCVESSPSAPARALDVVFVVDVSTTMGGTVDLIRRQIEALDLANGRLVDVRYGLVTFVDDVELAGAPYPTVFSRGREVAQELARVQARASANLQLHHEAANSDWRENSLDALDQAARVYPWRPGHGTRRMIVWVTDDTFGPKGATLSEVVKVAHGYDEVVTSLTSRDIQVVAFGAWLGGPARDQDVSAGILAPYDGRPSISRVTGGLSLPLEALARGSVELGDPVRVLAYGGTLCLTGPSRPRL